MHKYSKFVENDCYWMDLQLQSTITVFNIFVTFISGCGDLTDINMDSLSL